MSVLVSLSYLGLVKALLNRILMESCPLGIYVITYSHNRNPRGERIDYIFLSSPALIKDLRGISSWED